MNAKISPIARGLVAAIFSLIFGSTTDHAGAATIFESGTLGATGLDIETVTGTNVTPNTFVGVKFELSRPVVTSQVGGHFVDRSNGTFFGAIVALDGEDDFPDSGDLSTPDVLGHAELVFPVPSAEVFGDLRLALDPGWYALAFGSGSFGTLGFGSAVRNGSDVDDPTYIAALPPITDLWNNITSFPNHRFVVRGEIVPEPAAPIAGLAAIASATLHRRCGWNSRHIL